MSPAAAAASGLPAFAPRSGFYAIGAMAGFAGMRYSELLGQILGAAVERLSVVGKSTAPQVEAAQ